MATTADLIINIAPNAVGRILELGIWPEIGAMLEHTKQTTPGLRSISVSFDDQAGEGEASLIIVAEADAVPVAAGGADEPRERQWDRWAVQTFPPDVLRHVCAMILPAADTPPDGR